MVYVYAVGVGVGFAASGVFALSGQLSMSLAFLNLGCLFGVLYLDTRIEHHIRKYFRKEGIG